MPLRPIPLLLLAACAAAPGLESAPVDVASSRLGRSAGTGLIDLYGQSVAPLESGGRPVVLFFACARCPITDAYAPEIERLAGEYGGEVDFWIVYADPREDVDLLREHARSQGYRVRIARDTRHELVREARVSVTPEAAVFSGSGELVYSGRIDDAWVDPGERRPQPTVRDLERVLLALLAGTELGPIRTTAVGTPLGDVP
jgi:hypothetical protein